MWRTMDLAKRINCAPKCVYLRNNSIVDRSTLRVGEMSDMIMLVIMVIIFDSASDSLGPWFSKR
jgi:hypothetical protein